MNGVNLIFKQIDYSISDDYRKLDSIFRNWFSNPKTLNFVSPKTIYPFQMKDWVKNNYYHKIDDVISITVSKKDWVIGYGSISMKEDTAHLFHIIIDKEYRCKGIGYSLVKELEKIGVKRNRNTFTLKVLKKNKIAINFYKKSGYEEVRESLKSIKMVKSI